MLSPRTVTPRRQVGRRLALWTGLVVGGFLPSTGCQVEYAGMTLPSGKYMRDDVQYFEPSTNFPWANTQAATARARLQASGDLPVGAGIPGAVGPEAVPAVPGAANPIQNPIGGQGDPNQAGFMQEGAGVAPAQPTPPAPVPAPIPQP